MATESAPSSTTLDNALYDPSPAFANEQQAKAFKELKALCEKNRTNWPASELETVSADGMNNDVTMM